MWQTRPPAVTPRYKINKAKLRRLSARLRAAFTLQNALALSGCGLQHRITLLAAQYLDDVGKHAREFACH